MIFGQRRLDKLFVTWISLGTVPESVVHKNVWYKLEHTFEVHQRYIRYIFNEGGRDG